MKILLFTTHISLDDDPRFSHNKTGFGYMVYDIAKSIGRRETTDLFCANIMNGGVCRDSVQILKWNWLLFFKGFSFVNLNRGIRFIQKYKPSFFTSLRVVYAYLLSGFIRRILKNYDIIQIHGCSFYSQAIIEVCKKENVPFLVTLHGLNSFNESIGAEPSMCQFERDFLSSSLKNNYHISFISSGDIKKTCDFLSVNTKPVNFHLVLNGCDVTPQKPTYDVRSKYMIKDTDFIFLYVGNITKNKNQIAVARAYRLLSEEERNRTKVLFCGASCDNEELSTYIVENRLSEQLICCGAIPKTDIHNYYISSNSTVMTSISEGFGLSIIEGFVYGNPNLSFSDLSAINDLYNAEVMMTTNRGTDESLAMAMHTMICREWDTDFIKRYASNFSLELMAKNYVSIFKNIISIIS